MKCKMLLILMVMLAIAGKPSSFHAAEKPAPASSKQGPEIVVQLGHADSVHSVVFFQMENIVKADMAWIS